MAVDIQGKIDAAKEKVAGLKSVLGEAKPDTRQRAEIRKAVKRLKRHQRRAKLSGAGKARIESQNANRLKNIQKADEKAAKKEAAAETALQAAAEADVRSEPAAGEDAASAEGDAAEKSAE